MDGVHAQQFVSEEPVLRFSVERAVLVQALGRCGTIVESKTTIPILSHILIEATEAGTLKITATDLDMAIYEEIPANVEKEGSITVRSGVLYDIVRKCPDGAVIDIMQPSEGAQVTVQFGKSEFKLSALPVIDFPVISSQELPYKFSFPAKELKRLVDVTHIAMGTEETRPSLNGVYFQVYEDGVARGVATDGHRLSMFDIGTPSGDPLVSVIIHSKTVAQLRRMVQDLTQDVQIELSEAQIRFSYNDIVLISRLVDAAYPDYTRALPDEPPYHLSVDAKMFLDAVDRVSIIAHDKMNLVRLSLQPGMMTLSAISNDYGSATEEIDVGYMGPELVFAFNARYVREIGDKFTGRELEIRFSDANSASVICDPEEQSLLYVLMPVAI